MQPSDLIDKFYKLPKSVQQSILGSSGGVATGYTLMKFGKSAGFSLGATIMIVQLGIKLGYIKINWGNVERDIQKAKEQVEKQAATHIPGLNNQINENLITVTSFVGGFFIGTSLA